MKYYSIKSLLKGTKNKNKFRKTCSHQVLQTWQDELKKRKMNKETHLPLGKYVNRFKLFSDNESSLP